MIVVDTSAWVEYLRATGSPADRSLTRSLGHEALGVPDVARLELLAGAREDGVDSLVRFLAAFEPLPARSPEDHDLAAALFRRARSAGRTVRAPLDCLVAAVALRLDAPLLAQDRDFTALAAVSDLRLLP